MLEIGKKNNLKVVIHLAAIVPIKDVNKKKKKPKDVNFLGTKNIIDTLKQSTVEWFFHLHHMFINLLLKFLKEAKKVQFLIMEKPNCWPKTIL